MSLASLPARTTKFCESPEPSPTWKLWKLSRCIISPRQCNTASWTAECECPRLLSQGAGEAYELADPTASHDLRHANIAGATAACSRAFLLPHSARLKSGIRRNGDVSLSHWGHMLMRECWGSARFFLLPVNRLSSPLSRA